MNSHQPSAYDLARNDVALADRSDRVRLRVAGPDRARFLHNLTTNEVKKLAPGQGREAFVTSLQGKTLGWVTMHVGPESILLRADPGTLSALLPHFEKYALFDDVSWQDVSETTREYHLLGPEATAEIERLGLPAPGEKPYSSASGTIGGVDVLVVREEPTGRPGFTLIGPRELEPALRSIGLGSDLSILSASVFDILRIEGGTPVFGRELTEANLPQELNRDRLAISFVKGCYLGQETVARIDSLGHVNRKLVGVRLDRPALAGTELHGELGTVGTLTSTAFSLGWGHPIGLAMVRIAQTAAGTILSFEVDGQAGSATVSDLPMVPPAAVSEGTSQPAT